MADKKDFKIWTANSQAPAGVMVTPESSFLIGTPKNFIVASKEGLGFIGKSITIGTTSENLRQGGLFVNTNDFMKLIPSNMYFPVPSQIPFPPLAAMWTAVKDTAFLIAATILK